MTHAFRIAEKEFRLASIDDESIVDIRRPYDRKLHFVEAGDGFQLAKLPGIVLFPALFQGELGEKVLAIVERELQIPHNETNLSRHYGYYIDPIEDGDLNKSLRWMTLGYQYDWTEKVYPEETPGFPQDLADIIHDIFGITSEASIVNFYKPKDYLSGHVDQSEHCNAPLVSISLGLDAIFLVAPSVRETPTALRLRHGDVVVMKDDDRFAAHGICLVAKTQDPLAGSIFENRRININARQVFPTS